MVFRLFFKLVVQNILIFRSPNYTDDVTWAAVWLYKATNSSEYFGKAIQYYAEFELNEVTNEFYYNNKIAGIQVLLADVTKDKYYEESIKAFCDHAYRKQKFTPLGLIYIDKFGTLSHAANIAFVCLQVTSNCL